MALLSRYYNELRTKPHGFNGISRTYHETRTYPHDFNGISFTLRVRKIKRTFMRSASGRETLVQQTTLPKLYKELVHKIHPSLLVDEETCRLLVDGFLLQIERIPDGTGIRDYVVPRISKEVMKLLSRYQEKGGGTGFLFVTEVGEIHETWITDVINHDDSEDHRQIQTQQDSCAICLEALAESRTIELFFDKRIIELLCSHSFHRDCIFQWLDRNLSCPICRYDDI